MGPPPPAAFIRKMRMNPGPTLRTDASSGSVGGVATGTSGAETSDTQMTNEQKIELRKWVLSKLTVEEKGGLDSERFKFANDGSANELRLARGVYTNAIRDEIVKVTRRIAVNAGILGRYEDAEVYAESLLKGDRNGEIEIHLMALIISVRDRIPQATLDTYLEYVESRAEALRNGYLPVFDLDGKIYVVKQREARSTLRNAA